MRPTSRSSCSIRQPRPCATMNSWPCLIIWTGRTCGSRPGCSPASNRLRRKRWRCRRERAGGVLVLIVGMLGLWAHQPWLFPSLGPTIFLQVLEPQQPSSRPYHIVVGHAIGIGAAVLAVLLCAAESTPPVFIAHLLSGERVSASALAVSLMLLGQVLLKAAHPPAAATVLLITLGAFKMAWR